MEEKISIRIKKEVLMSVLAFIIAFISAMAIMTVSAHADNEIKHINGGEWKGEVAWYFEYNGQKAFCIQSNVGPGPNHEKDLKRKVYENDNMLKALYYGWFGQEPWAGFDNNKAKGIVVTSRVLSDFYKGTNNDSLEGVKEFKEFLNTKPVPPKGLAHFAKSELKATWDPAKKVQVTDENEVKGDPNATVTFKLPDNGVRLIKDGEIVKGPEVTLKVGDKFYLEADAGVTDEYNTGEVGKKFKYQPIVFETPPNQQDIGHLNIVEDKAAITSFKAMWLKFSEVEISKKDITNKEELPGAKMKVTDAESGKLVDEWVSEKKAHIIKNLVEGRKYILSETLAPKGYKLSTEKIEFIAGSDTKVTMYNRLEKKPEKPKKPGKPKPGGGVRTGDNTEWILPVVSLAIATLLLLLVVIRRKKMKMK